MIKIATILGARPQFIKAAPVSRAFLNADIKETVIHTGQHYDDKMSDVFFREMNIPAPTINLAVGSGSHGKQTGLMLIKIEEILLKESPDIVLVYGDTNSTLAGALAACKLRIPIAHIEAGLRSFNRDMPEEHNRILTDHCADILFCPTSAAIKNLAREGIEQGTHLVGDTMYDAVLAYAKISDRRSEIISNLGLAPKEYLLATLHRPYNTDDSVCLKRILKAFCKIEKPVVFPVHPRTRKKINELDGRFIANLLNTNLKIIEPIGYLDMLMLEKNAKMILTDSGGMQKEAYFFGVPCITIRPETEWTETVNSGWNRLFDPEKNNIVDILLDHNRPKEHPSLFGDGLAARRIPEILKNSVCQ